METKEASFHLNEASKHLEELHKGAITAKQEIQASNLIERLGILEKLIDGLDKRLKKLEERE